MKKTRLLFLGLPLIAGLIFSSGAYAQYEVPFANITVDGSVGDWASVPDTVLGVPDGTDFAVTFSVAWNHQSLFLLFQVEDDTAVVYKTPEATGIDAWNVDNIEIDIDADNSKLVWTTGGAYYDGLNDFHLRIFRDTLYEFSTGEWANAIGVIPDLGNFQITDPPATKGVWDTTYMDGLVGMGADMATVETGTGYIYEIAFPFNGFLTKADASMDSTDFAIDSLIGLRVMVKDNDKATNGVDASASWGGTAWKDPSSWGTIILTDAMTNIDDAEVAEIAVYPNPVADVLTVVGEQINAVQIMNITGNIMVNEMFGGVSKAEIGLSSLASGLYIIQVETNGGVVTQTVIKE